MTMAQILPIPTVTLVEDRPATTSLAIAEHFGKRHDDVLKSIRRLCTELPAEKRARNFAETFRTVAGPNNSERQELFFTVYFDGFILLVMGYTGKKALQIKLAYIDAFNAMREELEGRQASPTPAPEPSPISRRTDPERKALTAIINTWVGMAPIHYAAARAQVNAHLGVASVDAMTVAQVKEAIQYVQGKIDALPAAPSMPPAIEDRRIPDAMAELRELVTHCGRVRNIVHMECHPGGVSMSLSAQEREAYYAFQGMYQTAVDNMYAATHALDTCLKLRAMYPIRG